MEVSTSMRGEKCKKFGFDSKNIIRNLDLIPNFFNFEPNIYGYDTTNYIGKSEIFDRRE